MKPVHETPTRPLDYAALSATYGTLLGTVVLAAREHGVEPVQGRDLPALGLAAFALSKLIAKEKVETWVREPFLDEASRRPKGKGMRYAVGELLGCTRCLGAWSSLGLVALRVTRPREARVVTAVLATSALNDFLQTAFTLLCARTNTTEKIEQLKERELATTT
ncbi:MAG TPA: DUF1360 domain-containing protein [Capillimicrobium sp.]|nr:DUF1360 domain-containing protein [Capillimicrobium sp.]